MSNPTDFSREVFFPGIDKIKFSGPSSDDPFAYRYYDKDRMVLGKRMEEHLRMAVCFWHTFCWDGFDIFGSGTFNRPWHGPTNNQEAADKKIAASFEFFEKLGLPFYCFHDIDVIESSPTPDQFSKNLARAGDYLQAFQEKTGIRLLWGTANLFNHPRYAAGGLTNPDPEVAACGVRQIRDCLNLTNQLGGSNYVLWGGREGYDTLLNTDLKQERENFGRLLGKIVDHKHKIGFPGKIMIEPKPHEPMYHQYDYDTATVYGFLKHFDLHGEVHVNIETNHATLAGHSFAHEVATAVSLDIMGSVDLNCGNAQNGWDTDQFNLDVREITLALIELIPAGGLDTGGFNLDAKVRRQSNTAEDLFHGHIGAVDTLARALLSAEAILNSGEIEKLKKTRYEGWQGDLGQKLLDPKSGLDAIADLAKTANIDGHHTSGQQERLENIVSRHLI